ncbi:RNA recognition motif domain-containing protein [Candidatus Nitrospira bockiana]
MSNIFFVDGLPRNVTPARLQAVAAPFGTVIAVVIARRPHSGFLPFGLVSMAAAEEARAAIEGLNGTRMDAHVVRADLSLSPPFGWMTESDGNDGVQDDDVTRQSGNRMVG